MCANKPTKKITGILRRLTDGLTFQRIAFIVLGAMICSFGIHNIHQRTGITEGGVIGLMLFTEHWLGISPSLSALLLIVSAVLAAVANRREDEEEERAMRATSEI